MIRIKMLGAVLAAASLSFLPSLASAAAPTVEFVGTGSSALWQTAGIAAYELAGTGASHYTFKLTGSGVGVLDTRNTTNIAPEQGSLWIVWDSAVSKIYAGVSLDSTVGNRLFLGTVAVSGSDVPAGELVLPATIPASAQLISSALWGADATTLPTAISSALTGSRVTAALTDIRPEDAAFATARASATLGSTVSDGAHSYYGLGYTGALSATVTDTNYVESSYSSAAFQVVKFNTHGTDPYTSASIPTFSTYRVGVSPIIVFGNRTNTSGLGAKNGSAYYFTNLTSAELQTLWTGNTDNTSAFSVAGAPSVPLTVNQREPLSGTYNTFEYQAIEAPYVASPAAQDSQEDNVNPTLATGNPLDLESTNGSGFRKRAIGTGEMVNTAVLGTADSVGYAFFSFGNFSKLAGSANYGYFTVNGYDPLYASYSSSNGEFPVTGTLTLSQLFSNVTSGNYPIWSDLRIVTYNYGAAGSPTQSNTTTVNALDTQIQSDINGGKQYPDFIPFSGINIYRSHYSNGTYTNGTASNGLGGAAENGSDVNGHIELGKTAPGTLNTRL